MEAFHDTIMHSFVDKDNADEERLCQALIKAFAPRYKKSKAAKSAVSKTKVEYRSICFIILEYAFSTHFVCNNTCI